MTPHAKCTNGVAIGRNWRGIQFAPAGKTFHKAKVPIDPTWVTSVLYAVPAMNRVESTLEKCQRIRKFPANFLASPVEPV